MADTAVPLAGKRSTPLFIERQEDAFWPCLRVRVRTVTANRAQRRVRIEPLVWTASG